MELRKILTSITLLFCLSSFGQAYLYIEGTVLNNMGQNITLTVKPLYDVAPSLDSYEITTDTNGYFHIGYLWGYQYSQGSVLVPWIQVSYSDCSGLVRCVAQPGVCNSIHTMWPYFYLTLDWCWTSVTDCNGLLDGPTIPGAACDDGDPYTLNDAIDSNCQCHGIQPSAVALFEVDQLEQNGTLIPWQITTTNSSSGLIPQIYEWYFVHMGEGQGTYNYSFEPTYTISEPGEYIIGLKLDYGAGVFSYFPISFVTDSAGYIHLGETDLDCTGVLYGTNRRGTPCDDGDPYTVGDRWDWDCQCFGRSCAAIDCLWIPNGTNLPGNPCDDNNPNTSNDVWNTNCYCVGIPISNLDCLGIPNGPALPGTPCDDNDTNTISDQWDANCNCVGFNTNPCYALFLVAQAQDSATGPIPNSIWVYTNYQQTAGMSVLWDFGDGATSTALYPQHTYSTAGPYLLCLTISGPSCLSTFCDTLEVDPNGVIINMQGGGGGFSVNVIGNVSTGVEQLNEQVIDLSLFPNPTTDVLNVTFGSTKATKAQLEVVDLSGRSIQRQQFNVRIGSNSMSLKTILLDNGTYLLRITTDGFRTTKPFVNLNQ